MSIHKNAILVPIDFSDQSLTALDQSYNLAREYNVGITLLYVIEEKSGGLSKIFNSKKHDEELKKVVEENLQKLAAESSKKSGIKIDTLVTSGNPYEKIVEVAEMVKAIFIIMGCNGEKEARKRFIGANALNVVRDSHIPVITIKGKHHRNGCKNIVLPLDLTKETKEKVNKAIEIAKLGNGATINVVSVLLTKDEFLTNKLTRQLQSVKAFIEKQGVAVTAEMINAESNGSSLADSVIDYANKVSGDLIIIMTQQELESTRFFLGSSAQEIIIRSDIPVMSIIPQVKKDTTVFQPY